MQIHPPWVPAHEFMPPVVGRNTRLLKPHAAVANPVRKVVIVRDGDAVLVDAKEAPAPSREATMLDPSLPPPADPFEGLVS